MKRALALVLVFLLAMSVLSGCSGGGGGEIGGGGGSGGGTLSKEDLIIMMGNSITRRTDWSGKMPDNTVMNMAVDGAMSSAILGRLNSALSHNPKVICVMGGINDLIAKHSVSSVYGHLESLAIRARDAGVHVILQSTLMTGAEYPNAGVINPQVRDDLNPRLSALASREENIDYLELNSVLGNGFETKDEYLMQDHLHLNDQAYNLWASQLQNALP